MLSFGAPAGAPNAVASIKDAKVRVAIEHVAEVLIVLQGLKDKPSFRKCDCRAARKKTR